MSGVVIPFPQRARAPAVLRVDAGTGVDWRVRAAHALRDAAGDAFVAVLVAAMAAGDAWLLGAVFGVAR